MTTRTPLFMDVNSTYSGDELALPYKDIVKEGVIGLGVAKGNGLKVSQRAAGANLSVDVAAGACYVKGDTSPALQPTYRCYNDAVVNLGITPDTVNPRYVSIIAQVTDEGFAGSGRKWDLVALHGTPAGSPVAPATPDSALLLAVILVVQNATSITDAVILDQRREAVSGFGGGQILLLPGAATLPDGSAGNLAPGLTRRQGTEANPKKHFLTLDFDGGGNLETAWWTFGMPEDYHGGGGGLHILWMANAITGNVKWQAKISYTHWSPVPADTPLEHTPVNALPTTVPVNTVEARRLNLSPMAMLGDQYNDTLREAGLITVGLYRDSADAADTMTVDAEVIAVSLEF
jgi:hypothetical protein